MVTHVPHGGRFVPASTGYGSTMENNQRDRFVDSLNSDLRLEYQSIVQYIQHIALITGAELTSTVDELKIHLRQELDHATVLAEQIAFLGGTPAVTIPEIATLEDSQQALRADLELESTQLERYRTRVAEAVDLGLPDVAEELRPLLTQTQEHVRDLRSALGE